MAGNDTNSPGGDPSSPRRRRARYPGSHPRQFSQRYKELEPAQFPELHEHIRRQGRTPAGTHVPIMVDEVLAALSPQPGDVVADCTIGYGGHAQRLIQGIGPTGRLIGLDIDQTELQRTAHRLGATLITSVDDAPARQACDPTSPRIRLYRSHFAGLGNVLRFERLDGFDVIFADLGLSSMQIDDPERGFSYKFDGLLDMRMDDRLPLTAADLLTRLSPDDLSTALRELADEPDHERIAHRIVERRAAQPITHTRQLVRLIFEVKGLTRQSWRRMAADNPAELHPAACTFQALRILVNDELKGLEQFLRAAPYCLRPKGRIAILSFHSGEHDRVERAFREGISAGLYVAVSDTPLRPSPAEVHANPRSRSAQLRVARRA